MAINHGSLSAELTPRGVVGGRVQNSVIAYENDYERLINKPSVNNVELDGDLSLEDLGIVNNVQPDWEQDDTEAEDYIKNKPYIPENLSDLNDDADHRTVSDTEKTTWNNKSDFSGSYNDLTDKPVIPDAQIQSDWNQNDNTKADYIKNKPTIPAEQVNSDWNAESGKAQILNKPSIPTALADLTDDSTHRTVTDTEKTAWNSGEANVQSNWNETDTTSDAYIQNKPSIPSITANPGSTTATLSSIGIDGTNYAISGGSGGGAVDSVNGQIGVVVLDAEDVGALPDDIPLFSGDYDDLTNKPTIPDDLADLNDDSTHRLVTDTEKTTWNNKSDFSGSYNDLSNKPTLGTASALNVSASGDASTSEVVLGNDTRLTDDRNAKDVYPWAKASTKPSYTATEVGAIASTSKGTANGVAELDANGKVPSSQLPSYVDDTVEGYLYNGVFYSDSAHEHPITGETGKIYVELVSNKTYRWSGSAYVEISESLALGETSSTAYAGNKGKANADNISAIQGLIPSGASTSNKLATASDINFKYAVMPSGTDLNSLVNNGVYSVPISNDSTQHSPVNGVWVHVYVTNIGEDTNYVSQTLFAGDNAGNTYNYIRSSFNSTFNEWKQIISYQNKGDNTVDFNSLTEPGIYTLNVSGRTAQHSPSDYGWYSVYVTTINSSSTSVQQIAISEANTNIKPNIYSRIKVSGTWGDWDKIPLSSEVTYKQETFYRQSLGNSTNVHITCPCEFNVTVGNETANNRKLCIRPLASYGDFTGFIIGRATMLSFKILVDGNKNIYSISAKDIFDPSRDVTEIALSSSDSTVLEFSHGAWYSFCIYGFGGNINNWFNMLEMWVENVTS